MEKGDVIPSPLTADKFKQGDFSSQPSPPHRSLSYLHSLWDPGEEWLHRGAPLPARTYVGGRVGVCVYIYIYMCVCGLCTLAVASRPWPYPAAHITWSWAHSICHSKANMTLTTSRLRAISSRIQCCCHSWWSFRYLSGHRCRGFPLPSCGSVSP